MDRKTILAAAGALVLTVVGGMSALAVAFGGTPAPTTSTDAATTDSTVVVTEYVDQAGNPIAAPGTVSATAPETVIVPVQGQAEEIVRMAGGTGVAASTSAQGSTDSTVGATGGGGWTDDDGEFEGSDDLAGSHDDHEDEEFGDD